MYSLLGTRLVLRICSDGPNCASHSFHTLAHTDHSMYSLQGLFCHIDILSFVPMFFLVPEVVVHASLSTWSALGDISRTLHLANPSLSPDLTFNVISLEDFPDCTD